MGARTRSGRAAATACAVALLAACSGGSDDDPALTAAPPEDTGAATAEPTGDATEVADPVATTLPGPEEGAGAGPGDGGDRTGAPGEDPTATERPEMTEEPEGAGGSGTERAVLTRLELEIPADWQVADMGHAEAADPQAGEIAPHLWCLLPPEGLPPVDGCGGVVVAIGGDWLPGASGSRYQPNQAGAWWSGQAEPQCPFGQEDADGEAAEGEPGEGEPGDGDGAEGAGPPDPAVTANDGLPLTSHSTTVGPHAVRYETWRVTCESSGETLTPQLWHLPELNVLVKDYYGHPDTVAVLHGLDGD